jgi:hypothetical protein
MKRNTYPEMNKLIRLLVLNGIPFEVLAFPAFSAPREEDADFGLQIFSPSLEKPMIDAVCHWGTYGYEKGLIEIQSALIPDSPNKWEWEDGIRGWLTAEEALEYFKEVPKAQVKKYLV